MAIRLNNEEVAAIKQIILGLDPQAAIYLFGSRTKADRRGGDIDLLCLSGQLDEEDGRKIRIRLQDRLGEQKIDLILAPSLNTPFLRMIIEEAVPL